MSEVLIIVWLGEGNCFPAMFMCVVEVIVPSDHKGVSSLASLPGNPKEHSPNIYSKSRICFRESATDLGSHP